MLTHDYTEFDAKVISHIRAQVRTVSSLCAALNTDAKPFVNRPGEEFRVVDRRLQALRKKGLISWSRLGRHVIWSVLA
jgi:hypothetical protein